MSKRTIYMEKQIPEIFNSYQRICINKNWVKTENRREKIANEWVQRVFKWIFVEKKTKTEEKNCLFFFVLYMTEKERERKREKSMALNKRDRFSFRWSKRYSKCSILSVLSLFEPLPFHVELNKLICPIMKPFHCKRGQQPCLQGLQTAPFCTHTHTHHLS